LFATHFHELTSLSHEIPFVTNSHVEAAVEDNHVTLLYQVAPGPCSQSFGIHIAEMTGFPADIIKNAREKAFQFESIDRPHVERESRDLISKWTIKFDKVQKMAEGIQKKKEVEELIKNLNDMKMKNTLINKLLKNM
jgi:DNA mismatch repair ATPase MutS